MSTSVVMASILETLYARLPAEDAARANGLQRLATSFLAASGYDQAGEPVEGDDRGALEPVAGLGWLDVNPNWRAIAEEHCSPRQLDVLRGYADGLGPTAIGLRLGIPRQSVITHLRRAEAKMRRCITQCPTSDGGTTAGPHGGADHIESAEMPILYGPRSPESDPERIRCVPFFPARDRPELFSAPSRAEAAHASGYWTMLPRNARDIAHEPATVQGRDATRMPPVPDFYPDVGMQAIDSRRVLLSTVGLRPVVTIQADGESAGKHAARHRRRVEAWLALDENRPRLEKKHAYSPPRSRILPNAC